MLLRIDLSFAGKLRNSWGESKYTFFRNLSICPTVQSSRQCLTFIYNVIPAPFHARGWNGKSRLIWMLKLRHYHLPVRFASLSKKWYISYPNCKDGTFLKRLIIAIDGPAASGKSTTAKLVAEKLGYLHVDTGAMYRAFTLKVLQEGIDIQDTASIVRLVPQTTVRLLHKEGKLIVLLDGADVSEEIRRPKVTKAVSAVSSIPEVRALMVREQQAMGKNGGIVLEGRDIGTVVFPKADVKIFMIADARERARRRNKELAERGTDIPIEELEKDIIDRDKKDASRAISPLKQAKDAVVLDTTTLSVEEQVEFIVAKALEKMK